MKKPNKETSKRSTPQVLLVLIVWLLPRLLGARLCAQVRLHVRESEQRTAAACLGQRRPPAFSASFIDRSTGCSINLFFCVSGSRSIAPRQSGLLSPISSQPQREDRNALSPNLAQTLKRRGRERIRSIESNPGLAQGPVRTHSRPLARSPHHHAHPYETHRCGLGAPAIACQELQPHKQAAPLSLSTEADWRLALTRSTGVVYP